MEEIKLVLQDPEGIYYRKDDKDEAWFFVTGDDKTKKVVLVIEKFGIHHRVGTAHVLKNDEFQRRTNRLQLIWEKQ